MLFGRNRESRSREAAGRRNWPEAVPREMCGKKRVLTEISRNWDQELRRRALSVPAIHLVFESGHKFLRNPSTSTNYSVQSAAGGSRR